jgi:hypothetical protein
MNGLTFIPGSPDPLEREANPEHGILKKGYQSVLAEQ